jgi:hypothetical protein
MHVLGATAGAWHAWSLVDLVVALQNETSTHDLPAAWSSMNKQHQQPAVRRHVQLDLQHNCCMIFNHPAGVLLCHERSCCGWQMCSTTPTCPDSTLAVQRREVPR